SMQNRRAASHTENKQEVQASEMPLVLQEPADELQGMVPLKSDQTTSSGQIQPQEQDGIARKPSSPPETAPAHPPSNKQPEPQNPKSDDPARSPCCGYRPSDL